MNETYRSESGCRGRSRRSVIHSNPGVVTIIKLICYLRNALVGAIPGFEVQIRCPVVRFVLFEVTCGA